MMELTDIQSTFVRHLVLTGCTPTEAARHAGYAHAAQRATELVRKPHIVAAIREEQSRILDGDLTNVAMRTLKEVMENPKSPASARVAASRAVLEASGHFRRDRETLIEDKDPLDMTTQELEAFIRKSRKQAGLMNSTSGNA